jgi:hypothetical protein
MTQTTLLVSNVSPDKFSNISDGGLFVETNLGEFMVDRAHHGDVLVYLLTRLTKEKKLVWTVERGKNWKGWPKTRYITITEGVKFKLFSNDEGQKQLFVKPDGASIGFLTSSRLITELVEEVCLLVDPENRPLFIPILSMEEDYERAQREAAEKGISVLRELKDRDQA